MIMKIGVQPQSEHRIKKLVVQTEFLALSWKWSINIASGRKA